MSTDAAAAQDQVTILLVDDHLMVREGLRSMLAGGSCEVVGEAASGAEALDQVRLLMPQIVLLDIRMPDMDGLEAVAKIRDLSPETRIIMLTAFEDVSYLRQAVDAGATGFLLKGISRSALMSAINVVHSGGSSIEGRMLRDLTSAPAGNTRPKLMPGGLHELSPREIEVLKHLTRGLSNKEIAREMHCSAGTVKNILQKIFLTLGVSDRTQAAVLGATSGIV